MDWEQKTNSCDARKDILGRCSCCNEIYFNTLKDGGMFFTVKSQTTFLWSRERYLDKKMFRVNCYNLLTLIHHLIISFSVSIGIRHRLKAHLVLVVNVILKDIFTANLMRVIYPYSNYFKRTDQDDPRNNILYNPQGDILVHIVLLLHMSVLNCNFLFFV